MSKTNNPASLPDRPLMPENYGISGKKEGLLEWGYPEKRLVEARNYWLATVSETGQPHVSPVWGLWDENAFYFGTDPLSRKGRNLTANPSACLHLESGDEVVIVEGAISTLSELDQELPRHLDASYQEKYGVQLASSPVFRLTPSKVFAWREADFPNTATRWTFEHERPVEDR